MSRVRLAYVLGAFPSLTETFILRELLELRRQGVDPVLFSLRRPAGRLAQADAEALRASVCYRPPLCSPTAMAAQGYYLVRHPVRLLRAIGRTVRAGGGDPIALLKGLRNLPGAAFFARHAERSGVAHIHAHFAFMPADVARMMADLLGVGFSFSVHAGDIYLQSSAVLARKVHAARFVTACTRYGAEELARRAGPVPEGKIHQFYHGLPLGSFPVEGEGARPPATREPLILSVGRLQPKKGFAILVEACGLLRDRGLAFRCQIAGEGPERRALASRIDRLRLAGMVTLLGERSSAEVAALLRQARVFALPCIIAPNGDRDSLPNVILEALAAGVPVVTTPVAGIPEAIEDRRTGLLVPPGDPRELAGRIEELLKSEALCRTIATFGRTTVTERFDVVRNVAPLAALFERMRITT